MKHSHHLVPTTCFLLLLSASAWAYHQPEVNLGFTSFLDGGPPAGPGFYFTEYVQYYTADKFPDFAVPGIEPEVDAWVSLNQFIYQSDTPVLLGGKWGLDVIVPVVCINAEPAAVLPDNDAGVGDILVGPFLQWDPIMGKQGPVFMHRVEFQMILPTGKYDEKEALNPGSNHFSFDPYWAGTLFLTPQWTASWRAHYLWNDKNDDPFVGFGAADIQAGQAFHVNFASDYEVIAKQLRVGVNGYYFKEFRESEINGDELDGRERVLAIGPGALLSFSQDTHLFFNVYFEMEAENRPEGERFVLRLVHHF